jgi:hypothetical protein
MFNMFQGFSTQDWVLTLKMSLLWHPKAWQEVKKGQLFEKFSRSVAWQIWGIGKLEPSAEVQPERWKERCKMM